MNLKFNYKLLAATAISAGLLACEPEVEIQQFDSGQANFSTYVALGNSLTAGYADGALNRTGQEYSYPNILASLMMTANSELEFNQPLLPMGRANQTLVLTGFTQEGLPILVPEAAGLGPAEIFAPVSGSYQNLGVPGATVGDLTLAGYGSSQGNPYFARFATTPTTTMVDMAVAQNPTFFTLWIGNNDVLGYATAGGEGVITEPAQFEDSYRAIIEQLVNANASIEGAVANIPDVSKIPYFTTVRWNQFAVDQAQADQINAGLQAQIDPLVRQQVIFGASIQVIANEQVFTEEFIRQKQAGKSDQEAQGAAAAYIQSAQGLADIGAYITSLTNDQSPSGMYQDVVARYQDALAAEADSDENTSLTTVFGQVLGTDFGGLVAAGVDAEQAAQITGLKAMKFYPTFVGGPNGFVVDDPNSPTGLRQVTEADLITLRVSSAPASEFNPTAGDITIPGKYVLDISEQAAVAQAIVAYNNIIAEIAQENTFALVDMNNFFDRVTSTGGIVVDGNTFTAGFITGNAFSLDGVHLTPRGYALAARKFVESINSYYKSNLPYPNLDNYPAVDFPN